MFCSRCGRDLGSPKPGEWTICPSCGIKYSQPREIMNTGNDGKPKGIPVLGRVILGIFIAMGIFVLFWIGVLFYTLCIVGHKHRTLHALLVTWHKIQSPLPASANMTAGRIFDWDKSENGNGMEIIAPTEGVTTPGPPQV